jgi:hypothetical protein
MDVTEVRVLGIVGIIVVGLVTTVGAVALSLLAAGMVQVGLGLAHWLERVRGAIGSVPVTPMRGSGVEQPLPLTPADHALLARQAWWRLRC